MEHINQMVEKFKEEDGRLYAIYGTPAENLCGLQVQQFRKKHGVIENVSDRDYVSNSFHCHVSEEISPIEKYSRVKGDTRLNDAKMAEIADRKSM